MVTKLTVLAPGELAPGSTFQTRVKVKNAGGGAATSKATFLLSLDAKLGKGDIRVSAASVRRLKAKRVAAAKKSLLVPTQASGSYRVLACVDIAAKLKERNERNNCRASSTRLRIGAAAAKEGGGNGQQQQQPPPPPPSFSGSFPLAANPRSVSFTPETGNAVSEVVPSTGGELTTEGSDGTLYVLDLPADSLFNDTKVTMTPLASIGGAPLSGGMVGGVQLQPEGLTLNEPATLTIEPTGPVPPAGQRTGYLAEGDGQDFHFYPLDFDGGFQVTLMHFTLAGAGGASGSDRSAAGGTMPVTNQAQWEALVADRINLAHEREAAGTPDGEWQRDLEPVHLAYYRDVVKPAMDAALNDEAAVDNAIREGLGWLRKIELFGDPSDSDFDDPREQIQVQLGEILENALKRSNDACVKSHDLRAIRRIVQIARTGQLLGYDLGTGLADVIQCLRFELDMESRIVYPDAEYHVALKDVLLEAQYFNDELTFAGARAEKQIEWIEFKSHGEGSFECPVGEEPPSMNFLETNDDGASEPIATAALTFDLSPVQAGAQPPADDTFGAKIQFNTNEPTETYRVSGTGPCVEPGTFPGLVWENQWANSLLIHPSPLYEVVKQGDPLMGSSPITTFTRVQRGSGEPLLQVLINDSIAAGINEQTTVEVFHRPLE